MAIIRRIATRATRRTLPSRQYGLWVKCGPAGMRPGQWAEKWGGCCAPLRGGGAGSPSNTMSRRPRPTSVPSGILIHLAVLRIRHGPVRGEPYFHAKNFREATAAKR